MGDYEREQIKVAADRMWTELSGDLRIFISTVKRFSPQSLWIVEFLFRRYGGDSVNKGGSLLDPNQRDKRDIQFDLGAYVGEVVRRFHGEKCTWGNQDHENDIELLLPGENTPPLFPMRFIGEQIRSWNRGSIVEWGEKAGLNVGKKPLRPEARFRQPM